MAERVNTPFTNEHFAAYCLKMVGQPYWYGCCGYKATTNLLNRKAAQYPSHYSSSRMGRYKQDICEKKVVCDCIGGAKGYAWSDGGRALLDAIGTDSAVPSKYGANGCPDKSANGMFTYTKSKGMAWGMIGTLPEIVGLALHKDGHIGYYVGNGYAVEWKGFSYGCVKTKVQGRGWTHWYKLPFIDYNDGAGQIAPPAADVPESVPQPDAAKPVGIKVVIVSHGGKVNIRRGNGTEYSRLSSAAPGTTFAYVATATNGWHAVVVAGQVGWVSGNLSRVLGGD